MAMFSNTRATNSGNSNHLFEIKAGRCNLVAGSTVQRRKVVSDKTRGLIYIHQSSDHLLHFCWRNLENGNVVDDLIIFPGEADFFKVKECTDGKVYLLKIKASNERHVYWIQESNAEADKDMCQKVTDLLNKPPSSTNRAGARGSSDRISSLSAFQNEGSGMEQNQFLNMLRMLGGNGNSREILNQLMRETGVPSRSSASTASQPTAPAASEVPPSAERISEMQSIISNLSEQTNKPKNVDLNDVFKITRVVDTVRANISEFADKVVDVEKDPDSKHTREEEAIATIPQPHFQQAVGMFGYALNSGQASPILHQFGLPDDVLRAADTGDVLEFAKKLTEHERKAASSVESAPQSSSSPEEPREPEPKRGKPDDEQMDLD